MQLVLTNSAKRNTRVQDIMIAVNWVYEQCLWANQSIAHQYLFIKIVCKEIKIYIVL